MLFENDDEILNDESLSEEEKELKEKKIVEAYLSFTSKFSDYVKQVDPLLWRRAVDYAKTFTEEDVPGISLSYEDVEEEGENEKR
jgi:hypothetical protein